VLKRTRVGTTMDTGRLGAAIGYPGIDPRSWVSLAVVEAVNVSADHGQLVDVQLLPSGAHQTARVGAEYARGGAGFYVPIDVDDEVLVEAPDGHPGHGLVVVRRLWSPADPLPAEAVANPADVLLRVLDGLSLRLVVSGAGKMVAASPDLRLGEESAAQSSMRGTAYREAEDTLLTALSTLLAAMTTYTTAIKSIADPSGTATTAFDTAITAMTTAISSFKGAGSSYLAPAVKLP
jgi:hypothetical protein